MLETSSALESGKQISPNPAPHKKTKTTETTPISGTPSHLLGNSGAHMTNGNSTTTTSTTSNTSANPAPQNNNNNHHDVDMDENSIDIDEGVGLERNQSDFGGIQWEKKPTNVELMKMPFFNRVIKQSVAQIKILNKKIDKLEKTLANHKEMLDSESKLKNGVQIKYLEFGGSVLPKDADQEDIDALRNIQQHYRSQYITTLINSKTKILTKLKDQLNHGMNQIMMPKFAAFVTRRLVLGHLFTHNKIVQLG